MKHAIDEEFLKICLSLSSERDREKLLSDILDSAMVFNDCDAGTLYLLVDKGLEFCRMVTRSLGIRQGGHDAPISLPPVPLEEKYVSSWAVMHGETVYVDSVRGNTSFDLSGSKRYDEMTGYFTGTMCVVPMTNDKGETIGALQLINAMDENGKICAFDRKVGLMTRAFASLSAISLTNMQYSHQIEELLSSLVRALSAAIDQRTPYNENHTRNMVRYGERFLDWLEETGDPMAFSKDKRDAFIMSVWLHDVGKLVIPLSVMDKATRLGPDLEPVLTRLRVIGLLTRIEKLEGRRSGEEESAVLGELAGAAEFIKKINSAGFLDDESLAKVEELAARTYTNENGEVKPWLTEDEVKALSVRKGTLTAEERAVMESHVTATAKILSEVFFPKKYKNTPLWAAAHHELLNGRGYPDHLTGADIPQEVRLLTILDVFDALTARDRPYKAPMPVEKALSILHSMAGEGSIDEHILELFEKSKAWEDTK